MDLLNFIMGVATNHDVLIYGLIIILGAIEGPIVSIIAGILFRWDFLPYFLPLYVSLMAGDLIGDVVWYSIGYKAGRKFATRFGKYFGITEKGIIRFEKLFHTHKDTILITSKLTTGFGLAPAVLFTAGLVKVSFRRYIIINLFGQFIWTALLMFLGYSFAHLYSAFDNLFARTSLIAIAAVVIFLIVRYARHLRQRFLDNQD
jgi:membrane protein DedA with SNARE-associated domain